MEHAGGASSKAKTAHGASLDIDFPCRFERLSRRSFGNGRCAHSARKAESIRQSVISEEYDDHQRPGTTTTRDREDRRFGSSASGFAKLAGDGRPLRRHAVHDARFGGWVVLMGVGIWGINNPVGWGFDIINFVWWIGIGHAGTLISAILVAAAPELAHFDQPIRRSDDDFRGLLRRSLS